MDEMLYAMHVLTVIITCTFLVELEVQEDKFGSYIRLGVIEDDHGYYIHEKEIIVLHVIPSGMLKQIQMVEEMGRSLPL